MPRKCWLLLLSVGMIAGALASGSARAADGVGSADRRCDRTPTDISVEDNYLDFLVPPGLMPDPQFTDRPAKIQVHRVQPVYAHGRCSNVPSRAAVLVHGRSLPGTPVFDLRQPVARGETLSMQQALARAGIDTFAPSLLGYARSTRFDTGLDDPGNASLRPYLPDGSCPYPEGCDRSHLPFFHLDQQGTLLLNNPLGGERVAHSSNSRFGRTDVWVRDVRQVIDDAIERARPTDGKVTLVGYSLGGTTVGRTLYAANPVLPGSDAVIAKVNRAVYSSSLFGTPTEEAAPATGFTSFPTNLSVRSTSDATWAMPQDRDVACTGHTVPGSQEQMWNQLMEEDPVGRSWGGTDPAQPTGVNRTPTFSSYGWNSTVAHQQTTPSLVIDGLDDTTPMATPADSRALYDSLGTSKKVLVQVQCASHAMLWEGCSGPRCTPRTGKPYGTAAGRVWPGPHATAQAAITEWIKNGTFTGATNGRFTVDESGVAHPAP
ncbi:alpha/beta fold hydrolase [Streptomyces diastatochromogenes]|uniref:AB hydrolase-1 domain-containing protein n=1 Tax=Streptomyces diastatochromogenes TaxID=42236 RepID=A0A233SPS2_STRDA|nr:alpha/beta fold hydrolase [Streptomyces diastatochromogenes]MCZ0987922.1 alpha/beta fold hydrolase [Streptomyces diastatochromogenes]OXY97636.1 hypothetical protein BEK98_08760 [Streptomyces diastatochromogenes]